MYKGKRLVKTTITVLILLLPAVILRLFTSLYPFLRTAYISFKDYDISRGTNFFNGIGNYIRITKDIVVVNSISFTVLFVVLSTIGEVFLGLIVALILNSRSKFQKVGRTVNLIPWAIAPIAGALIFRWLFDSEWGFAGFFPEFITNFVSTSSFWGARNAVILANIWRNVPFMAVIFLASLQSIPSEIYEAAKVDGANYLQIFRNITIPLIKPMVTIVTILYIIWQLAAFDIIYGMTGGGPGYATEVLSHKVYISTFSGLNFGYAAAIGMVLFVIVSVVGIIGFTIWRKQEVTL
ncbi:MAG: sugar ABC transporter permease [Actinobacteria bacterium]|nr:sugar ABC transporter permease [Actinomycetota bacterium]